ncbi:MAG: lamin tail domain-containing protein [Methanosarcinales archaeon]
MPKNKLLLVIPLVLIAVISLWLFATNPEKNSNPTYTFYGNIDINGEPAPINTIIIAEIANEVSGTTTTTETGKYDLNIKITSYKNKKYINKYISFYIKVEKSYIKANQRRTLNSKRHTYVLNLTVNKGGEDKIVKSEENLQYSSDGIAKRRLVSRRRAVQNNTSHSTQFTPHFDNPCKMDLLIFNVSASIISTELNSSDYNTSTDEYDDLINDSITVVAINWTTDKPSNSLVRYGTSKKRIESVVLNTTNVIFHSIILKNLKPYTNYYFAVQSTDIYGNTAIDNNNGSFYKFTTSKKPLIEPVFYFSFLMPHDIIISEIMWDEKEYIELYNTLNSTINLQGWTITSGDGGRDDKIDIVIDKNALIPSKGYYVIADKGATKCASEIDEMSFNNSGEIVQLFNGNPENAIRVDIANTNDSWFAGINNKFGVSMERIGKDGSVASSWQTSTGYYCGRKGTPSKNNSVVKQTKINASTLVINEFIPNPIGRDRGNETIELYNTNGTKLDISGLILKNEDGDEYIIPRGSFTDADGYWTTTKIQLDNKNGQIFLYQGNTEIDRTLYYQVSKEGKSWSRIPNGYDTNNDTDWKITEPTLGYTNPNP